MPTAARVLLVAAVCGADLRLDHRRVRRAAAWTSVALGEAEDLGLVTVRDGRVEFRHPLLRAAVYSGASAQERRAAHRAAADALRPRDVDRRAWHLSEAIWHPDAAVADLLAEAGEHAVARAPRTRSHRARSSARRGSLPTPTTRGARLLRAADTAWTAGDGERALALLDQHARDAGSPTAGRRAPTASARSSCGRRSRPAPARCARRSTSCCAAADRAPPADAAGDRCWPTPCTRPTTSATRARPRRWPIGSRAAGRGDASRGPARSG